MKTVFLKLIKNKFIRLFLILLLSIFTGLFLLLLANRIPQEDMLTGAANSINEMLDTMENDYAVNGYSGSRLDIFTDGALINSALCITNESLLRRTVAVNSYSFKDMGPCESVIHYIWMDEGYSIGTYSRYWYGILIFIKPLLKIMSYRDIRVLIAIIQIILMCILVCCLGSRKMYLSAMSVPLLYLFLVPEAMQKSIQYSTVFFIAMTASICLCIFFDKIRKLNIFEELFFLTGILTSYFDLLTYPLFTLGIPVCFMIMLIIKSDDEKTISLRNTFKKMCNVSVSWGLGYILMWAGKWIISCIVLGTKTFDEVIASFKLRSFMGIDTGETSELFYVINENLSMYNKPFYKYILIALIIALIAGFIFSPPPAGYRENLKKSALFLPVIISPFIWYALATEHSFTHSWFTFRTLCVGLFGLLSLISTIWDKKVK